MKVIVKKAKFWILWFLLTSMLGLIVTLSQMYAREETLDNVREVDFRVVYASTLQSDDLAAGFKLAADEISINNRQFVLFPMALLTKDSCVNNGALDTSNSLCKTFLDIDDWKSKAVIPRGKEREEKYFTYKNTSYLFRSVNQDVMLIGKAGAYSNFNPFANGNVSFSKRVLTYYLGSKKGFEKLIKKGKWALIIIFTSSLVLTVLYRRLMSLMERHHLEKVRKLQAELDGKDEEWSRLRSENMQINEKLRKNKTDLMVLKDKIHDEQEKGRSNTEDLMKQAIALEDEKAELFKEKENLEFRILELEDEIEKLDKKKQSQADKAGREGLETELRMARQRLNEVDKLWRRKTNWNERLRIEQKVCPEQQRVPFTTSTAFIAFEKYVDDYYEALISHFSDVEPTLKEKIDFIGRKMPEVRNEMHEVRIARNEWFHDGKPPEMGLVKKLIKLIEKEEARI